MNLQLAERERKISSAYIALSMTNIFELCDNAFVLDSESEDNNDRRLTSYRPRNDSYDWGQDIEYLRTSRGLLSRLTEKKNKFNITDTRETGS